MFNGEKRRAGSERTEEFTSIWTRQKRTRDRFLSLVLFSMLVLVGAYIYCPIRDARVSGKVGGAALDRVVAGIPFVDTWG